MIKGRKPFWKMSVLFLIFIWLLSFPVFADIDSPFQTTSIDSSEAETAIYRLNLQYETKEYKGDGEIESFDVNQNGEVIISIAGTKGYNINFYQQDGSFSHCIFVDPKSQGSILALFDRTDRQLLLYDFRPDKIFKIDHNGECLEVKEIPKQFNPDPIINEIRSKSEVTVNGTYYSLKNRDSLFKTPALTMTLPNGETKTIFAQTERGVFNRIIKCLIPVFILVGGGLIIFFKYFYPSMRKKKENKNQSLHHPITT